VFSKELNRKCQIKGFTLIELLVVIAIIALLLSILMPSLQKAKKIAQTVVCSSNMKQLALASLVYAADNQEKIVLAINPDGDLWVSSLEPYYVDPDIKGCPSAKKHKDIDSTISANNGRHGGRDADGACYESWWSFLADGTSVHISSYGMNGFAQSPEGNSAFVRNRKEYFFGKSTVRMASSVPLITASTWRQAWMPEDSSTITFSDVPEYCSDNLVKRFIFIRHDDRNNVSFLDGHVERIYLPDMGRLKWHRNWVSRELVIPWLKN
jgi:prepilin-type N-terminal cleavage/methylation domain-containing protein/prepilin-type processing-associated H-X9-DG protein